MNEVSEHRRDINVWINFSLYAVLGKLAEADGMMSMHGDRIRRVAEFLTQRSPPPAIPLYRGMLVDQDTPVRRDERYPFISWSEDRDVAIWFASRESVISENLVASNPRVRGVVLELTAQRVVLFHHSWATDGWADLARMHPHMGDEGARQVAWSLATQREVITAPLELPPAIAVAELDHPPIADLDRRLAPPWIDAVHS